MPAFELDHRDGIATGLRNVNLPVSLIDCDSARGFRVYHLRHHASLCRIDNDERRRGGMRQKYLAIRNRDLIEARTARNVDHS